jgi:putative membrane protein
MDNGFLGSGISAGFFELWNPVVLLLVVVVGALYVQAVGPWRQHFEGAEPVRFKHKLSFVTGLLLFYVAQGSPLAYVGHHYLFSAHMLQQSILYLIMPPLLLIGTPAWLVRFLLKPKWLGGIVKASVKPLFALFWFNLVFSFYHIPFIMDAVMENEWLQLLYQTVLLIAAFQMWFPVFCPLPEWDGLSELKKMAYIFLNGILLTPACALIIFAGKPLYAMYMNVTPPFPYLHTVDDQQLGGVIMKILQEVVYGLALGYTFFKWFRKERKNDELSDQPHEEGLAGLNRA